MVKAFEPAPQKPVAGIETTCVLLRKVERLSLNVMSDAVSVVLKLVRVNSMVVVSPAWIELLMNVLLSSGAKLMNKLSVEGMPVVDRPSTVPDGAEVTFGYSPLTAAAGMPSNMLKVQLDSGANEAPVRVNKEVPES